MPSVLGIPDRSEFGNLSQLKPGQLYDWIVQRHLAARAGEHYDVRFGNPSTGLFSWASRKGLPLPGEKRLAVQQPLHSHSYRTFEGTIPEGYGKGTVKKHDEGKILITKVEPGKVHFTVAHKRYPERYVLVKPTSNTGVGSKPNNWLLMNITPTQPIPFEKEHYKSIPADKVEPILENLQPGSSVQAKIDGALTLTKLLKDKIEVMSYRTSKVHGGPILHSERVFHGLPETKVPKEYVGSVLQGELYGQQHGQGAIPPQVLGGILNSSLAKSYATQKADSVNLKQMIFDIQQLGKKKIDRHKVPYAQRSQLIHDILGSISGPAGQQVQSTIHAPEEAKSPEEALRLYKEIASGKHPTTEEGIVIHPATGKPMKAKLFEESDAYIRGMFPGKGKWLDRGVGGFVYSHTPRGAVVGEVGTGFDDLTRMDMFNNPDFYTGKKVRIRHTGKLPSGALFQPSYLGLHQG